MRGRIEVITFGDGTSLDRAAFEPSATVLANLAPIALEDDAIEVSAAGTIIAAATLLANDYDYEGEQLSVTGVSGAVGGTVALNGEGDIVFTADGSSQTPSFTYRVSDGAQSTTATVTLTLVGNSAPIALTPLLDQASDEDQAVSFALPADAFGDIDGDALTLTATLAGGGGSARRACL